MERNTYQERNHLYIKRKGRQKVARKRIKQVYCPDCGSLMKFREVNINEKNPFFFICTRPKCTGKHMANRNGTPIGKPINKRGRYQRYMIHEILDQVFDSKELQRIFIISHVQNQHIGKLNNAQLDILSHQVKLLKEEPWRKELFLAKLELEEFIMNKMRILKMDLYTITRSKDY